MNFTKMHGIGNDFLIFEYEKNIDYNKLAKKVCARRLSVGADGIMVVIPSDTADIRMRIINADGSEAEMCGNGIRCFAKYIYEKGIINKKDMAVETLAGIIRPKLTVKDGLVINIKVDMGMPDFNRESIHMKGSSKKVLDEQITVAGQSINISSMIMGVPHTMIFLPSIDDAPTEVLGPAIETHELFPNKTNVNFVEVLDEQTIRVETWERGAGFTLACGTGCCASGVAAYLLGKTKRNVTVKVTVGELYIEYDNDGRVFMTGPAEKVFEGVF